MVSCRTFLAWLCCALVLCAGLPLRASAPCEAGPTPSRSACCGDDSLCSDVLLPSACDCGGGKLPDSTPQQPELRQVQAPAPRLLPPLPATAASSATSDLPAPDQPALPHGLLPSRPRQEAHSVWRC